MNNIWNGQFLKALLERVLATFLATFLASVTVDGFDVRHADWSTILILSGTAAGYSLIKGLLANLATKDGPGVTDAEVVRGEGVNRP